MKKEVKEQSGASKFFSVIFLILVIIIGLISFLTAIVGFFTGKTLFGVLYLILAIFCFLPRKIIRIPNWAKFLIAFTASIVLLIMSISLNWNLATSTTLFNHNLQETFILEGGASNISTIFYNSTKEQTIILNGKEKTTEGYFLIINGAFTNLGEATVTLNPTYYIIDNQNKTYAGIGFGGSQEYFQPNLKKQSYFIFELPTSAQGLHFYLKGNKGTHVISLGI